jgi:hypothetical protein
LVDGFCIFIQLSHLFSGEEIAQGSDGRIGEKFGKPEGKKSSFKKVKTHYFIEFDVKHWVIRINSTR